MAKIDDGGPAFPQLGLSTEQYFDHARGRESERERLFTNGGMSLRDYFAAKAMTGLMSSRSAMFWDSTTELAVRSYKIADALLRARRAQSPADIQAQHLGEFGKP